MSEDVHEIKPYDKDEARTVHLDTRTLSQHMLENAFARISGRPEPWIIIHTEVKNVTPKVSDEQEVLPPGPMRALADSAATIDEEGPDGETRIVR